MTGEIDLNSFSLVVQTSQELNVNILKRANEINRKLRETYLHEILENYKGGILNQQRNLGTFLQQ